MKKKVWKLTLIYDLDKEYTFKDCNDMIDFINDMNDIDLYKPLTFSNFCNYYYHNKTQLPYIIDCYNIEMKQYIDNDMEMYYPHKQECNETTKWKYRNKLIDKEIENELEEELEEYGMEIED